MINNKKKQQKNNILMLWMDTMEMLINQCKNM